MSSVVRRLAVAGVALAAWGASQAAPTVVFGQNMLPGATVIGPPLTRHDEFMGMITGAVTETFEDQTTGLQAPVPLTFEGPGGKLSATLTESTPSPSGLIVDTNTATGARFNTTGATQGPTDGKWWSSSQGFSIDFGGNGITAFGFYATDVGDRNGQITLDFLDSDGGSTKYLLNSSIGTSGGLLFFGLVDSVKRYTRVTFGNTAAGSDTFGIDDLITVVAPTTPIPEPATLALLGACALGATAARRRRRG